MNPKTPFRILSAALGAFFVAGGWDASAQTSMPLKTNWVVSSQDLLQTALTNNLNIMLSRVQPQIDQFNLKGLYGSYEPSFTMNAVHLYNSFPSGAILTSTGLKSVATTEQINSYTPGLTGVAPWGLSYNFTGPLSEQNVAGSPDLYNSTPGVSLDQPLLKNLWIDNTRNNIYYAKATLRLDQLSLSNQIMTVVNSMKAAYYTLILDRELVSVQEMAVKLAEETAHEEEQKVQAGSVPPLDAKQAESQAANAHSDLLTAQATLAGQENTIKTLLGLRRDYWTDFTPVPAEKLVAVPETPDLHECWRLALEKRPDMLQAKLRAEAQHMQIKLDFNQMFPEVDLVGGYGRNATAFTFGGALGTVRQGDYPDYNYGIVMTIPLGDTTSRNKYRADKAALEQLSLQVKALELTIVPTVDNDVTKIKTDFLKVDSTRQARMYAEDALQAEQTKLEHGNSTAFLVLQAQQTLTARRSDEVQALANYNIDLDQLAFDDATILDRNHIQLRMR